MSPGVDALIAESSGQIRGMNEERGGFHWTVKPAAIHWVCGLPSSFR